MYSIQKYLLLLVLLGSCSGNHYHILEYQQDIKCVQWDLHQSKLNQLALDKIAYTMDMPLNGYKAQKGLDIEHDHSLVIINDRADTLVASENPRPKLIEGRYHWAVMHHYSKEEVDIRWLSVDSSIQDHLREPFMKQQIDSLRYVCFPKDKQKAPMHHYADFFLRGDSIPVLVPFQGTNSSISDNVLTFSSNMGWKCVLYIPHHAEVKLMHDNEWVIRNPHFPDKNLEIKLKWYTPATLPINPVPLFHTLHILENNLAHEGYLEISS